MLPELPGIVRRGLLLAQEAGMPKASGWSWVIKQIVLPRRCLTQLPPLPWMEIWLARHCGFHLICK